MAEKWLDVASQQAKLIAGRLNQLLSTGLTRLHSELGVDLGVKPEIPPWVILLAACIGLLLMVALWASACRGLLKKRPARVDVDQTVLDPRQAPVKAGNVRAEEQKKKKRKPTEKKSQLNGRAVVELQEEVSVSEEDNQPSGPHRTQTETENSSEVKKTKKKQKQTVKETKKAASEVKEPEEVSGSWETKVSNKEKREQRRKDKTPGDGSGSPGGVDPLPGAPPPEQHRASPKAAAPGSDKKMKKGDFSKTKSERTHVAVGAPQAVSSAKTPVGSLSVTGEWGDLTAPGLTSVTDEEHWSKADKTVPSTADGHQHTVWGKETEGGWTVIDAGITGLKTTDVHLASFTGLGHGTEAVESQPELQWLSPPQLQPEDQWSGLNGGSPAEGNGGSDWSPPAEVWGNYEETSAPEADQALSEPLPTELQQQTSEVEEAAPDGSGKSKKKKKKKKKQAEDASIPGQESEEPIRELVTDAKVKKQPTQVPAAVEVRVEKPVAVQKTTVPVTQVPPQPAPTEKPVKQSGLPAPAQKSTEESQPSKPVMKKKRARKET